MSFFFFLFFLMCALDFCLTAVGFLQRFCIESLYALCALCLLLPLMAVSEAYLSSWVLKQSCPYFCPNYFLFVAAHYKELCWCCLKAWEMWQNTGALGALWQRWLCQVLCLLYEPSQVLHQLQQNVPFRTSSMCMLHLVLSTASSQESWITAIWNTIFYLP